MTGSARDVLFLCTGNSARSILAEAILNGRGAGRLRGYSAGSHPRGAVHPMALELLRARGFDTAGLRSKSWSEFALPGAPPLDFVLTVCDAAAGEACPVWPGAPVTAHWSLPDPTAGSASAVERRRLFERVFRELERRIDRFAALPFERLDSAGLAQRLREIGADRVE